MRDRKKMVNERQELETRVSVVGLHAYCLMCLGGGNTELVPYWTAVVMGRMG